MNWTEEAKQELSKSRHISVCPECNGSGRHVFCKHRCRCVVVREVAERIARLMALREV